MQGQNNGVLRKYYTGVTTGFLKSVRAYALFRGPFSSVIKAEKHIYKKHFETGYHGIMLLNGTYIVTTLV